MESTASALASCEAKSVGLSLQWDTLLVCCSVRGVLCLFEGKH